MYVCGMRLHNDHIAESQHKLIDGDKFPRPLVTRAWLTSSALYVQSSVSVTPWLASVESRLIGIHDPVPALLLSMAWYAS